MLPNFSFETKLWKEKIQFVAGVDEVGRGALAGPIVAAAVIFKPFCKDIKKLKINDSKKLTPKIREELAQEIKNNCLFWAIGEVGVNYINKRGIGWANYLAMNKAIISVQRQMTNRPYLLIDGYPLKNSQGNMLRNQLPIVKGDQKVISIAAASIIAKVYRDNLMKNLAQQYKEYGWEENKGYGTKRHWQTINQLGPSKMHRKDFID